MIELRGITIDYPEGTKRIRLLTRSEWGDDYRTFEYPGESPLKESDILNFLSLKLKVKKEDIRIASHVKIPEV